MIKNTLKPTLVTLAFLMATSWITAQDFSFGVDATGDGSTYTMTAGFSPNATDGYDDGIDSYAPPAPPPPAFDAALGWGGDRYYTQILAGDGDLSEHVYDISLAYASDNLITISWDNTGWSDLMSSCWLQDSFGGVMFNVDMLTATSLELTNPAFNLLKLKVTPTDYSPPADPSVSITSPADGETLASGDFNVEYSVENFGIPDDGHVHVFVDGAANSYGSYMVYSTDPIELTGVPDGDHSITLQLVDTSHQPFDPSIESMVNVTVTEVQNTAPVLAAIGAQSTNEDTPLYLTLSATDVDGDALTYTASSDEENVTAVVDGTTLTLTPAANWNGTANITVTVSDGELEDSKVFELTVTPINDAPVMDAIETQTTLEDQPISMALNATDIDNETSDLSFDASTENTDIVTVSVTGNVLTLMPVEDATGPAEIEVWASDGEAESGHITFTLTVAPVNDAPVMDAIAAQTTNEETPLMIMVSSSDIDTGTGDGDENTPTYSAVSSSPDDVAVSINDDQLTMEPALDFHGDVTISVTVTDDGGLSDTTDFVLTVTPVNDAPVMDAIEAQTTLEDQPISMALNATDIDNETSDLSFDASTGNTDIVTVSVTGNLLTLTPVENATGPAVVEVWASDGDAESGHITFTLTVAPVNDAPIATDAVINPSIPTINDDLVLSYDYFDLEGDDESGTIITWFKDGVEQLEFSDQLTIPASATACDEEWYTEVTPSDGELFGQPVNSNTVTICADNTPPQWSEIDDQHINEDSGENTIDISGFITDNEQAPSQMTFQVIDNSDPDHLGTAFDGYNLLITPLVLDYHSTESIILTLQADDGFDEGVVTQTVNVFIDPVNDAPVAGFSWSAEDLTVTFTNTSADADGDALTHSWDFGDGGTSTEESPTHTYADEGTYTVSLTASDGDLSDTAVDNAVNAELSIGHETMIPGLFALHQNYPNPFNPITSLRYGLPEQALVTLTIYDLMGRKVTQLVSTTQEAGYQSVRWDATDSFGKPVSAGVYLYQIRAGDFVQTRKMVLLK